MLVKFNMLHEIDQILLYISHYYKNDIFADGQNGFLLVADDQRLLQIMHLCWRVASRQQKWVSQIHIIILKSQIPNPQSQSQIIVQINLSVTGCRWRGRESSYRPQAVIVEVVVERAVLHVLS